MSKKYGIGFLIATFALVGLFFLAYRISYNRALDKQETEERQMVQNELEICYYIKEADGYVIVLESDQKTPYEFTSILVEDLPEQISADSSGAPLVFDKLPKPGMIKATPIAIPRIMSEKNSFMPFFFSVSSILTSEKAHICLFFTITVQF